MQQFIASYLFQNKTCPLPGLGTLFIHSSGAISDFTIHQIAAPAPVIEFNATASDPGDLIHYMATKTNSSGHEAAGALDHFCTRLKNEISQNAWASLEGIGNFVVDNNGNIIFEQAGLPPVLLQPVFAERVIHPRAEHTMLVGDKETTNMAMTEFFNEAPAAKSKWWIWAIVLGAVALLILIIYFSSDKNAAAFGNAIKI